MAVDGSVTIKTDLDNSGVEKGVNGLQGNFKKLGSIAGSALAGVGAVAGTVATAFAGLVTASVSARGEIEQLVGGVETLFKDNADTVIKNAENAYKNAGMSASQYMETVTSFSASLLQSLGGNTAKASSYADRAIIDMADNANKMGTSMELIQNAYQGFAKQNYTMLDNLKLGYGGTQAEMQRLIQEASQMTDVQKELNITVDKSSMSFDNVVNAISVVQKKMGIMGTTAAEATGTLQGSMASMKASWNNFLSGSGNLGQVVDTATDVVKNVVRIVNEAIPDILSSIEDALPELLKLGEDILTQLIQGITTHLPSIMQSAVEVLDSLIKTIVEGLPQILETGITVLLELVKGITQALPELIPTIIDAVILMVETLIDNLDLVFDAGIELIIALIEGIFNALPDLIAKLPELVIKIALKLIELVVFKMPEVANKLVHSLITGIFSYANKMLTKIQEFFKGTIFEGLVNKVTDMAKIGLQWIQGLWNGINDAKTWILNKISGFCNGITDKIKGFFGIHSPSKLFADEIGKNLGLGIGEGFDDSLSSVYKSMQKAVEYENAKLTSNLTSTHQIQVTNEDNRQATLSSIDNNREIQVNSTLEVDGNKMASVVNKVNAKQKLQYGFA